MAQPTGENYFGILENLDINLSSGSIQPSSPTEESGLAVHYYDQNASESYYELDIADADLTLCVDQDFRNVISDFEQFSAPSPTMDYLEDLLKKGTEEWHSTESNDTAGPIQSNDEHLAMIKGNDPTTSPAMRLPTLRSSTRNQHDQSISLSASVAVTVPTPHQLQLAHPLEDTFRARYKSDYFPSKGDPRRPRYVADNVGNHFVSLQLPSEYNGDLKNEYICVSLLTTPSSNRGYFYSPYKFQINHNDVKIADQNPMYLPVVKCRERDSSLKLQLVLIKSKLDQLNDAQPLKPFLGTIGSVQNIINEGKLSPKDFIKEYQLEKSHIAFTLCTKISEDAYHIHPETTVISSVITELPPKVSKAQPEANTANNGKKISCPKCSHCFDLPDGEKGEKRKSSIRTSPTSSKAATNPRTTKKKKTV